MDRQHKTIAALVLILSCLDVLVVSSSEICTNSACHPSEPSIRFPFRLQTVQPKECGYPGFDLTCDSTNLTSLQLQNTSPPQRFSVQAIDYGSQEIWLNDPNNCLPQRLLTLNLSGSPFSAVSYQDFTLFNCSFDYKLYRFNPIACLSGSGYTIVATSSLEAVWILSSSCSFVSTIPVPVQWPYYEQVWSSDLSEDIKLTWGAPQCGKCESKGGRCGLKSNSSNLIECKTQHGLTSGARYAISVGAGVPTLLFVLGLVCYICGRFKACRRQSYPVMEFTSNLALQPTLVSGLDGATIESYPKTVLGDSRRLLRPDDNICPICLSEYKPKDTLRTIPGCQHCFHAACIDAWLPLNAACPVCRNNPKHSPPASELAPPSSDNV
ncbi:hypothetical protein ACH5RR_019779 [Cinchona calisaya]|uniref:RING-type domain-containing protein n=1 Tax=Cinchona calisaya TaxID=153742 RepID=A0ABD2ZQA9_9GENT